MPRCYLKRTSADVANEILIYHAAKPDQSHLVAEGPDDAKLYGRFVDHKRCRIVPAGDKSTAIEALSRLNQYGTRGRLRGYVVVVDIDFDEVTGSKSVDSNLVYTDGYNAECMLFRVADLRSLFIEFGVSPEEIPGELPQQVELEARKLGRLRLINRIHNLFLKFADLDFDEFFDADSMRIDEKALTEAVLRASHPTRLTAPDIERYISALPDKVARWHLVSGHDLMELLAAYLRFKSKDTKISDYRVASILRVRCSFDQFSKTRMHRDLVQWESRNAPYLVLEKVAVSSEAA